VFCVKSATEHETLDIIPIKEYFLHQHHASHPAHRLHRLCGSLWPPEGYGAFHPWDHQGHRSCGNLYIWVVVAAMATAATGELKDLSTRGKSSSFLFGK